MDVDNNSSNYNYSYEEADLIIECLFNMYHEITGASFITICCFSLLGNVLLIYILFRFEDIKRVTVLFVLNLAIFDLLFTLTLPFWAIDHLHQWIFGDVACKILNGIYFMGIYGNLILLTAMTVDRYFVIVLRSRWLVGRRRLKAAQLSCVGAWVIGAAVCLKEAMTSEVTALDNFVVCHAVQSQEDNAGYYTQFALIFLLPLTIIVFCYSRILHAFMSTPGRNKRRTVLVVLCIVVAFFICWGPYHVLIIVMCVQKSVSCAKQSELHRAYVVCRILAYSHCCVNPLLYMLRKRSRMILSSIVFRSPELNQQEARADLSHSNIHQHSMVERCRAEEQHVTGL